jgi:RNA polymerase-binding transcription factor DksA
MDDKKIAYFQKKLQEELAVLEGELATVSTKNPNNLEDWEPKKADLDIAQADRNEVADVLEEFGNNTAITRDLEIRLAEVKAALKRIEDNSYGVCEISGEPIEEDRLEANPAAATCKAHLNSNR